VVDLEWAHSVRALMHNTNMCSIMSPESSAACKPGSQEPVPLARLEREICELAGHLAAAMCRWLLLVAEFDAREGWREWGVVSCAHWLSWRCSIGANAAREHVRVARRLSELPQTRDAFARGELSYCKARALTRVATAEDETALVEIARHATGAQLEKLVRGYRSAIQATLASAQEAHARRDLQYHWGDDGMLRISGRLTADEGALLLQALASAEGTAPEPDGGSAGARGADALVALARNALDSGLPDRTGGEPCELVVHVDAETLRGEQIHDRAELDGGPALAPETVRRLGCDAAVVGIVERDGRPLSVGRRTRTIPPALRRALRSRDDGCQFPGCDHNRYLHAHHIRHWARGGPTSLDNLVQLCSHHHRLVHEGGFAVERAGPDSLRFRRPDGVPVPPAAECRGASGATLEQRHSAWAVPITTDTCRPLSAGQRLDYGLAVDAFMNSPIQRCPS
jgi:Domain of unknown function (DUF222)/HNH endonuclease